MMKRRGWVGLAAALLAGAVMASAQTRERAAEAEKNSASSLDAQLSGTAGPGRRQGVSIAEWQWNYRRFVNVGVGAEPAALEESIRVGFANRGDSYVRVTFRAKLESGFPAGLFQGRKEVSYTMERPYGRVVIRGRKFFAQAAGPFRLVEADPVGERYTLADFSTLGGIARGKNMVAVVDEAFGGQNLFTLEGKNLNFINQQFGNNGRAFPAQIVMEPVGEAEGRR